VRFGIACCVARLCYGIWLGKYLFKEKRVLFPSKNTFLKKKKILFPSKNTFSEKKKVFFPSKNTFSAMMPPKDHPVGRFLGRRSVRRN
jgi:hypothetical protein